MAIDAGYTITPLSGSGIQIQYSADGETWHSTFTDGDVYMRQKVDGGDWTDPIKIVGEDGKNAIAMNSATTPSGEYEGQVGIWQNQIYFWTNGEWVNQTPELPTDAVLHYSFDEVPDYPDGTAVYFKNKNFTGISGWNYNATRTVLSIDNGSLKVQSTGADNYAQIWGTPTNADNLAGKIIIIRFHTASNVDKVSLVDNGGSYTMHQLNVKSLGGNNYEIKQALDSSYQYQQLLTFRFNSISADNYVRIDSFYIGDGSYSTPIINNANGQNNAVNNGGIATKGLSGKGLLGFGKKNIITNSTFPKPTDKSSITLSIWVKYTDSYSDTVSRNLLGIGAFNGAFCIFQNYSTSQSSMRLTVFIRQDPSHQKSIGVNVTRNEWHNAVMVWENKTPTFYVDGNKYTTSALDISDFTFGGNTWRIGDTGVVQGNEPSVVGNIEYYVDDAQIFNRALSEKEVLALYQNKANTPKYYTMSDFSLEQIDDDNVVDHLTEKPQLLSKWLEIYNAKNVSSALPTSNVSTNGEYKGVINTANEVGVISTEQLVNYIQATNALRSALWGTNGYLVDMNTDSTLNGNLDTLFANYRETLQIARTQITQQQASVASALSVVNSNPFQLIPVNSQGEVITGGYDNTGTRLQVFNGTTVLTPKSASATLSNGEWKVTASGSGIVAGSQIVGTGDNKYIDFGNVSNLTAESAVITYTINVMLNNTLNTIYVVQKFGKSKEGADGRIYTLLPDFTAVKKSADGSVLTPSSVTVQAKSWTGSSIPEPYSQGDLVALENG